MSAPTYRLVEKEYRTDSNFAFVKCPSCGSIGKIDREQFEGKISIICSTCDWHETHDLRDQDAE